MATHTSRPFAKAFACAGVTVVVVVIAALVWLGGLPANVAYATELVLNLILTAVLAALATGLYARTGAGAWGMVRIVATYMAVFIAVAVLLAILSVFGKR